MTLVHDLPPLTALRAFDAAARHLNFTHAAAELAVGQPAISRQIGQLETWLGTPLFARQPSVALTDAGRRLHEATNGAFTGITRVASEIRRVASVSELTIDVSIAFASCWLLTRLAGFTAAFPDIAVRLVTRDVTSIADPAADVVVYYGTRERAPDAACVLPNRIVPACAASIPAHERPNQISALAEAPLLSLEGQADQDAWERVLRETGVNVPVITPQRRFTSFIVYREAMLKGQGIGLAWCGMMADDLESGLIEPVTDLVHSDPDRGYWVTTPNQNPAATQFRGWLLDLAQEHR